MLRSMYSGISGMRVNQTKLDVIGNNISNVGTTGFKSSRARFSDMLNQNISGAMAASQTQGGINASQIGLGVQLASIDDVMTQGNMQPTGRALDIAIDGEGFFMVSKGPAITGNQLQVNHRPGTHSITDQSLANIGSELMYSRDGSFILDNEGNLLTSSGYRVMGYSLTNDDSSMGATSQKPSEVNAAGFDFRFGPGSQLNGYKIVLGTVGPQTPASASVDKGSKIIILNGDFSSNTSLTADQVEAAINKGLSENGISQSIFVSGKPISIGELGSEGIKGGTDAISPNSLNFLGTTIKFTEGSYLNGYTFEVRNVNNQNGTNAEIVGKKIYIDGDFVNNPPTAKDIEMAINQILSEEKIEQQVKVTGTISKLPSLKTETTEGKKQVAPGIFIDNKYNSTTSEFAGFTVKTGPGGDLNGYSLKFGKGEGDISVQISGQEIIINGDLSKASSVDKINNEISRKLKDAGKNTTITLSGDYNQSGNKTIYFSKGETYESPKNVGFLGATIEFRSDDKDRISQLANFKFVIEDVNEADLNVTVDSDSKTIKIKGNFKELDVTASDLESAINEALKVATISDTVKISGKITSLDQFGFKSDEVQGGEDLSAPELVNVDGLEFVIKAGAALNGYKINIGTISSGTNTSATVDSKNKTITINADFVSQNGTSVDKITREINKALKESGIDQEIKVQGNPMSSINGVESEETYGGTSVQSIDEDGGINFVDGTKDLKSYDGSLKTLKIPDKVRIPGTDIELRVKTYTIDVSGVINGVLEDGRVAALGQIAMASFKNPEGLNKVGGNLYTGSVNSGDPIIKSGIGTLGEDNSRGYGDSLQGMLEMSNVDLAEQFTDMIVTSRAFQASGKMITTGDEILQDIINLKR